MNEFKKAVLHRLIDLNVTRREMAKELEISESYLCDILNGARDAGDQKKRITEYLTRKEMEQDAQAHG